MPRSPSSARTPSTRTSRPTICVLSPFFRNRSRPHPRLTIPPLPHSDLPRLPPMTPQRPPLRPQAAHRAQDNRHPRLGALVLCKDHYEPQRSCFCGVCLCDGVLGCMVKQDLVRVAQEALAHAERALWKMGQIYHGGCGERRVRGARGGGEDGREGAARGGDGGTRRDRGQRGRGDVPQRLCDVSRVSRRVALALCALSNTTAVAPEDAETSLLRSLRCVAPGVFAPMDPLMRAAVSALLDLGEGTVHNVLAVAGERQWLCAHTRWAELMGQVVTARRSNAGGGYNTSGATNANTGADRGRQDYSGYATTVLVKSGDRGRRRAQSASLESVEEYEEHQRQQKRPCDSDAYANNAVNNAAYARAGYTNTTTVDDYLLDEDDYDLYDDEEDDDDDDLELDGELDGRRGGGARPPLE
ncbi:hypothetical protein C8R44DRAFT_893895, partial [Mycena epipterygia]